MLRTTLGPVGAPDAYERPRSHTSRRRAHLGVIKVEDTNGQPRAVLMNYACHADVVCQNYAVSADYPGVACRKVEEAFGTNCLCLFVQGAAGNIESLIISSRRTGPDDPFQTDYNSIERVGHLLSYEAIKLTKSINANPARETSLRYLNDSLKFVGRFDKDKNFDVHIRTILINDDIAIAAVPGEPFVQLQLDWKRKVNIPHPFIFGYTWYDGTWPNYISSEKHSFAVELGSFLAQWHCMMHLLCEGSRCLCGRAGQLILLWL